MPHCGQCPAPLSSPSSAPHSRPGLAQGQTEARGAAVGISRASRGRWEPPFPSSFRPSPLFLSLLLFLYIPFLFPLLASSLLPRRRQGRERSGPALCSAVCGPRRGQAGTGGLCRKQTCRSVARRMKKTSQTAMEFSIWELEGATWPGLSQGGHAL